jgi:hypothetical protein
LIVGDSLKRFRRTQASKPHTSGGWAGVVGVGASNGLSAATKFDTNDSGPVWVGAAVLGMNCAVTAAVSKVCGAEWAGGADTVALPATCEAAILVEAAEAFASSVDEDVSVALPAVWLELFAAGTTGCGGPSFDLFSSVVSS